MTEYVLDYDPSVVPQETSYWCGPASAQVVLNGQGVIVTEQDMADQMGTGYNGTDNIELVTPVLNRYADGGGYAGHLMPDDPPSADQIEQLWSNIVTSVNGERGIIANIVAPPSNYPRGVKDSVSPAYSGGTVYHYIAVMGYDNGTERAVWIADSGFRPFGYWMAFDQLATLIPPKGYTASAGRKIVLGLDYAAGCPGGGAIKEAGFDFVVRYLASGGTRLPGKLLTPDEADDLRTHGVMIVSNWETYASRMLEGYAAGQADAELALAQARRCGSPENRPIYFSADWDATPDDQSAIDDYLRGAGLVVGYHNVGIYGGYGPVKRALDNGTALWAWQTGAWSGGRRDPRINMYQRIGTSFVGGVACDVNEAVTDDFGQWNGAGMALLDETFVNWQGHTVSVRTALRYLDLYNGLILDQLNGPGSREQDGKPTGWPQLAGPDGKPRTVVDAVAALLKMQTDIDDRLEAMAVVISSLKKA